jgi:ribA/ribD-fused uncharacterized protein
MATNNYQHVIFFCGHDETRNGKKVYFSNWYPVSFTDDQDIVYQNTEQYMMYKKAILFGDKMMADKILECSDPRKIKQMGRRVKNFKEDIWRQNAQDIVTQGCYYKFSQNPELKQFLLSTKDKIIVEASPYDKIWGIGLNTRDAMKIPMENWPGSNWLGECLMKVRHQISLD